MHLDELATKDDSKDSSSLITTTSGGMTGSEELVEHLSLDWSSNHGTPVYLTLWDFSPPSIAASLGMQLGLGIWHSQVWLPDINTEIAFGGHDEEDYTGIFNLPRDPYSFASPSARLPQIRCAKDQLIVDGLSLAFSQPQQVPAPGPSPLPDARYVGAWFVGYAGGPSTPEDEVRPSTGRWSAPQSGPHAFRELLFGPVSSTQGARSAHTSSWLSSWIPWASVSSRNSEYPNEGQGRGKPLIIEVDRKHPKTSGIRARSIAYVMQTIQEMKSDPQWNGKTYELLTHNCNHFTAAFLDRLTGAKLPAWINRTAGIGQVVSHIIPTSLLIDIDTTAPETEAGPSADDGADTEADTRSVPNSQSSSLARKPSITARVGEELSSATPAHHRPPDG